MIFSEKLSLLREKRGLSQEQLAERLDVPKQYVYEWESQRSLPNTSELVSLSIFFDVTIDQLLKDDLSIDDNNLPTVGKSNVVVCPSCGKENQVGSAFCGYCGNSLDSFLPDSMDIGEMEKSDVDLAYYKANLQMQQQALQMQRIELEETRKRTEQQQQQLELQRQQYEDMMKCPRCGSTSLSGNKKGYGIGKGIIGASILGPFGLVAGNIGSGKVLVTCMKCGKKFKV